MASTWNRAGQPNAATNPARTFNRTTPTDGVAAISLPQGHCVRLREDLSPLGRLGLIAVACNRRHPLTDPRVR
jgi:hypothetical protein